MNVHLENIASGWRGTARTVREMQRLVKQGRADPTVIYAASQVARKYDPKDYAGQARGFFKFVQKHIHYVKDPRGVELLRSPFWTLYYRAGDCDDQAVLFASLAEATGMRSRFKTVKADPSMPSQFSHVYSEVYLPSRGWTPADTIVKHADLGWETSEQDGAQVWGLGLIGTGGIGMLGAEKAVPEKNIWGKLAESFSGVVAATANVVGQNYVNKLATRYGMTQPSPRAAVTAPKVSYLIPFAIAGAAGLGAVMLFRKKRRG